MLRQWQCCGRYCDVGDSGVAFGAVAVGGVAFSGVAFSAVAVLWLAVLWSVLGVGVVGTTSDQSVLKPTPAPSVLDAIGDPSVLEP